MLCKYNHLMALNTINHLEKLWNKIQNDVGVIPRDEVEENVTHISYVQYSY